MHHLESPSNAERASRPESVLLIFLDGVGIGAFDRATNPFAHASLGFFPQFLDDRKGRVQQLPVGGSIAHPRALEAVHTWADACLGVVGTPQSATGQASLFTGRNCAALLGQHLPAFPNDALIEVVRRENFLIRAAQGGQRAAFLNAYTPRFHELGWPHSVSTVCALSLDAPLFMLEDAIAGRALYHDITQEGLRRYYGEQIPVYSPYEGGRRLAIAARAWQVSLFEHFWTDRVGHRAQLNDSVEQIGRVESFLAGVLEEADLNRELILVASDHGNIEESTSRGHTRNPVPISAWGPGSRRLCAGIHDLGDVVPALMKLLDLSDSTRHL